MAKKPTRKRHGRRVRHRGGRPGTAPGTVHAWPDALASHAQMIMLGPDGILELEVKDIQQIRDRLPRASLTWVNVDGVGDGQFIRALGKLFGLHSLALEDAVNVHQRPKVEEYGDHEFIVLRTAELAEGRLKTEQMAIFLGKSFVITFQERPGDCLNAVRAALREGSTKICKSGPDYLAYSIIDAIIDHYFPILEHYADLIDEVEERIFKSSTHDVAPLLYDIRSDLLALQRIAWPTRDAMNTLQRDGRSSFFAPENKIYLRDCHDHTIQVIDMIESSREMVSSLFDLVLSRSSQRLNEVMKVLTIISTIFIPLNFIAGVYGMNFHDEASPFNMPELNWYYGYPMVLTVMGLTSLGLVYFFKRKGWLTKDDLDFEAFVKTTGDKPERNSRRPADRPPESKPHGT